MGFEINPYNKCTANKIINRSQCTIGWYVDNKTILHADPKVIKELLDIFKAKFGALTITRGKTYKFLRMTLSIDDNKRLVLDMKEQIEEAVDMFKDALTGTVKTPAAKHLL